MAEAAAPDVQRRQVVEHGVAAADLEEPGQHQRDREARDHQNRDERAGPVRQPELGEDHVGDLDQ